MATASRLLAILFIAAHAWAASVPCGPASEEGVALTRQMNASAAQALLRSIDARPERTHAHHASVEAAEAKHPCHEPEEATPTEAAEAIDSAPAIEGPIRFFMPACPCGCDQRGAIAGASSARTGAGVPPAPLLEPTAMARSDVFEARAPAPPDVTPTGPEPVPRLHPFV